MNKAELAKKVSMNTGIGNKKAEEVINSIFNTFIEVLKKDEKVTISGFGTFLTKIRHARGGVNPQNPTEKITIPEVRVAKFKTGKRLKDSLKKK